MEFTVNLPKVNIPDTVLIQKQMAGITETPKYKKNLRNIHEAGENITAILGQQIPRSGAAETA